MQSLVERRSGRGREAFAFASSHDDMKMVLDSVVGPPGEQSCYGGPTIPLDPMSFKQSLFFFFSERFLGDVWIKLVVPSQSTAFPYEYPYYSSNSLYIYKTHRSNRKRFITYMGISRYEYIDYLIFHRDVEQWNSSSWDRILPRVAGDCRLQQVSSDLSGN